MLELTLFPDFRDACVHDCDKGDCHKGTVKPLLGLDHPGRVRVERTFTGLG